MSQKMHSFIFLELQLITVFFNSWFFYEVKYKVYKGVCGIFHFRFRLAFIKVGLSTSQKICFICFIESLLVIMMKYVFLFHPRSYFRSEDIYIFLSTFCSCRKNGFFGHVGTRETFFFENHAEYEAGKLVPDLFLFFQERFYFR